MDLTQLEFFRAVAQDGSITAAAGRLHRVPSNLTTRIKQLESELGAELFIREKSRLRLSPTGRSFLDYAERILDLVEEARQVASGAEPHGSFSLGSMESTAAVRIPELLARYHQRFPKVQLDLSTGPSGEMIDGVLRLADRSVRSIMTPRHEMVWVDLEDSPDEIRKTIADSGCSRFPVARGELDEIQGVIQTKDMLDRMLQGGPFDVAETMRPPLVVPELISLSR